MNQAEIIRRAMYGDDYDQLALDGVFDDPVVECPESEELVRKEFQREADVSFQLQQFMAGQAFPRRYHDGVVNYDVDRLEAEAIIERGNNLFAELPEHVRRQFGSWRGIEEAANNGELRAYFDKVKAEQSAGVVKSTAAKPPEILEN